MQMRALATEPRLFGLGGVEWYRASYADEENLRWVGRLFRHYGIEGHTGPATPDPYELTHVQNPDFADGTRGWEVSSAEEGSVRADKYSGYGWLEGRYTRSGLGDTFLVMRRSAQRPNTFRQQIKDLQPGRLYSLKMITGDYQDLLQGVSSQKLHAVSIKLDQTEVLPGPKNSFQFPHRSGSWAQAGPFQGGHPYWINYHWRVFRAQGTTARLTVSDWQSESDPGGPAGQELIVHFIEIQPYLGE
jgi:hypothetical protein